MVYKLFGRPQSRAFRVMWMLHELGEPYELDPVPPRDPKALALNPSGKIPILVVDGVPITDSVAICTYLADKHQRLTHAAGTIARAHQDSFTQFAVDDIESSLWTAAKHTFALPPEYRIKDVLRACRYDFDRGIAALAERLGDKVYVTGDEFTVPDLILGHCGGWATAVGWDAQDAKVRDYFQRVRSRPAFVAAFAEREQTAR